MKQYTITKPTKIELNNQLYLLQKGDKITIMENTQDYEEDPKGEKDYYDTEDQDTLEQALNELMRTEEKTEEPTEPVEEPIEEPTKPEPKDEIEATPTDEIDPDTLPTPEQTPGQETGYKYENNPNYAEIENKTLEEKAQIAIEINRKYGPDESMHYLSSKINPEELSTIITEIKKILNPTIEQPTRQTAKQQALAEF